MKAMGAEFGSRDDVDVVRLAADLTVQNAARRVYDFVREQDIDIEILINNEEFGRHGKFPEQASARSEAMNQVNVTLLCALTHMFVQEMVSRKRGKTLNIAPTAGFVPGPLEAVYHATRALVLSVS